MNHQQSNSTNISENVLKKIQDILEFYLSDSNIRHDKYLLNLIKLDNGWIELLKLYEFKKLKSFLSENNISILNNEQLEFIFKDNKKLIINQDKNKIKRTIEFKEDLNQKEILEIDERTIYIEPITNDLTLEVLTELLLQDKSILPKPESSKENIHDYLPHISIPRYPDRTLKGFSFVECSRKEIALKIIEQIDQFPEKYNNLISITKLEWLEKKKQFSYLLNNPSRYLKINNIPIYIKSINNQQTNGNQDKMKEDNDEDDDDDDEIKVIDENYKPILMNKPQLWKFFDNETNITVSYLQYSSGRSDAILKFSSIEDLQYAIDQFQQGEIKLYDNVLHIIQLTDDELSSLKEKVAKHEISKLKLSNPIKNNNYNKKHHKNNNYNNNNNNHRNHSHNNHNNNKNIPYFNKYNINENNENNENKRKRE